MSNLPAPKPDPAHTHTVARKQIGDLGQPYWNTCGPMTLEQSKAWKDKLPGLDWHIVEIRMEGRLLVVIEPDDGLANCPECQTANLPSGGDDYYICRTCMTHYGAGAM